MTKNIRRTSPWFSFELCGNEDYKMLWDAAHDISFNIAPIVITQKNLDADYQNILESTQDALMRNSLYVKQEPIYNGSFYELNTILHHSISGKWYEKRDPILCGKNNSAEFELSVKFLKIQSYIEILGLPIIDAEDDLLPLDKNSVNADRINQGDIKSFFECQRCFYITKKYPIKFKTYDDDKLINANTNDGVLKDEFDKCRRADRSHPLMISNGIAAVPFSHSNIPLWLNSSYGQGGISYYDKTRNLLLKGVPDEILINDQGKLIVVDFKTSSKSIISMDDESGTNYRRQVSFYSYLLQKNGYPVHAVGYIILNKPHVSKYSFSDIIFNKIPDDEYVFNPYSGDKKYKRILEFKPTVLEIKIDYSWIEETLDQISLCLRLNEPPQGLRNPLTHKRCFICEAYYRRKTYEDGLDKQKQKAKDSAQ